MKKIKVGNKVLIVAVVIVLGFISAVEAVEVNWNGYFGTNVVKEGLRDKPATIDPFVLSLISNIRIDEKTRILGQLDFEHGPFIDISVKGDDGSKLLDLRTSGELTLSNVYVEYAPFDFLKIRAGKSFAPIGFYNQIFYALPTYNLLCIPELSVYHRKSNIREDALFFQRYVVGLFLLGDINIGSGRLSYDLFVTNGRSFRLHVDDNDEKSIGGRLKFQLPIPNIRITPIVSFYTDEFNFATPVSPVWVTQLSVLPGLEVKWQEFTLRSEFALSNRRKEDGSKEDFNAFYADAWYTLFERFTPFLRFELLDPDADKGKDQERQITFGLAYHLSPWVSQIKLQIAYRTFENPDKKPYFIYAAGVALGF